MAEATTAQRTAAGRREAWSRLRKLPSKRLQARYPAPDGRLYSARTEEDRLLALAYSMDAIDGGVALNNDELRILGRPSIMPNGIPGVGVCR
jgi:hypothetical protein